MSDKNGNEDIKLAERIFKKQAEETGNGSTPVRLGLTELSIKDRSMGSSFNCAAVTIGKTTYFISDGSKDGSAPLPDNDEIQGRTTQRKPTGKDSEHLISKLQAAQVKLGL